MSRVVRLETPESFAVLAGASCAFGVFDGVHRGHRFIIDQAIRAAGSEGRSVALTFDIDPEELFRPQGLHKLMDNETRIGKLSHTGVDAVAVLAFTKEFSQLEPLEFLEGTFSGNLPASIHVGCDFRFGRKARGDAALLQDWARERDVEVHSHELLEYDGEPITSTRIRRLLEAGDYAQAALLLGE